MEIDKFVAVIYGDGSANNINGSYGAGATGYIYNTNTIGKKNSNIPSKYTITDTGYLENELLHKQKYYTVIPEKYIEGVFGFKDIGTNNRGEILAFICPMRELLKLEEYNITKFIFKTDSSYVVTILENLLAPGRDYSKQEWRSNLKENTDLIEEMDNIVKTLLNRNIELDVIKVKGHGTSLGNIIADRLALLARYSKIFKFCIVDEAKYWTKANTSSNTLIKFKQLFFINNLENNEHIYSIMEYKTGVEPGKKTHDAIFGTVKLSGTIDPIKDVMSIYNKYYNSLSILSTIDLSVLFNRMNTHYYELFGKDIFTINQKNNTLIGIDGEVVIKGVYPPGLATQAFNKMHDMIGLMDRCLEGSINEKELIVDITSEIYDTTKKKHYNCIIKNTQKELDLTVEAFGKKLNIFLTLGKDTLNRNQFKALEKTNPKVLLYLYKNNHIIEYYTIIANIEDKGIYTNMYSCRIFVE